MTFSVEKDKRQASLSLNLKRFLLFKFRRNLLGKKVGKFLEITGRYTLNTPKGVSRVYLHSNFSEISGGVGIGVLTSNASLLKRCLLLGLLVFDQ